MALIYPKAVNRVQSQNGGSMIGGPARCVIHTTETNPRWGPFESKIYYSMQVVEWPVGTVTGYQYIDFRVASRALFNGPHPVQTNRMGLFNPNVAIVGYAKDSPGLSDAMIDWLTDYFIWQEKTMKIPAIFPLVFQGGEAYGTGGVGRMSVEEWKAFTGICGHQDAPDGNTHWDPGKIPVDKFRQALLSKTGDPHMATYRTVKNVWTGSNGQVLPWVAQIIDRHIDRGIINVADDTPDDWEKDGRLWIMLDRAINPIEAETKKLRTDLNAARSGVTINRNEIEQLKSGSGSGGSGTAAVDNGLRAYLRNVPTA